LSLVQTHNKQHQTSKSLALVAQTYNTTRNQKKKKTRAKPKQSKNKSKSKENTKQSVKLGSRGGELSLF
jgi:uncharacterized protein YdaT